MRAVLDACVIYPPMLRDILMWLAAAGVYEPRWTEEIHGEWMRNFHEDRPEIPVHRIERTRKLMDNIHPDCLVVGYERRISGLTLPDKNDLHILAAAIESGASVIVTFNLKDFPRQSISMHGVQALHPDAFLGMLLSRNRPRFLSGLKQHRASLKNPAKSVDEYLSDMNSQGLSKTAKRVLPFYREI